MRWLVACLVLAPLTAAAHDVGLEVTANGTRKTDANPRTGSAGATLVGSVDLSDSVSLLGSLGALRDFGTRTPEASSSGSTIPLATLGAMVLPSDTLMLLANTAWAPPAVQLNATAVPWVNARGELVRTDAVIRSVSSSFAVQLGGAWLSSGDSAFESSVDVSASATRFETRQQLLVPNTVAGDLLRQRCAATTDTSSACQLVNGVTTPLWQLKVGGGYTATVKRNTDVTVDASLYLYDQDPTQVGVFSLVALGRGIDVGSGVPVLPLGLTLRASGLQRLGRVSLKLSYQLGFYVQGLGTNHLLTVRANWKLTDVWRLNLTVSGQGDSPSSTGTGLDNQGGSALVGVTAVF